MQLFEHCTASCGYAAAFVSCLSFGSFCVPMKGRAARECDVHPFVFQTYKTAMCLLTSFSVVFLGVDKLTFSPWGIVSGIFWVPAGITYVLGVRTAGLAMCHGTAASIIVMVSFSWGIFVFHERVRSLPSALFAVSLMIMGIFGMSFASAPTTTKKTAKGVGAKGMAGRTKSLDEDDSVGGGGGGGAYELGSIREEAGGSSREQRKKLHVGGEHDVVAGASLRKGGHETAALLRSGSDLEGGSHHAAQQCPQPSPHKFPPQSRSSLSAGQAQQAHQAAPRSCEHLPLHTVNSHHGSDPPPPSDMHHLDEEDDPAAKDKSRRGRRHHRSRSRSHSVSVPQRAVGAEAIVTTLSHHAKRLFGLNLSTRQMGLLIAALGAVWGGSVMVPLHYAGESAQGLGFVYSFAVGSTLVNLVLWILYVLVAFHQHGCDIGAALESLPSFHCSKMALPGAISGTLWSIGNMASMISVTYLGEGVGYSMTQSAMLVSGMWGIFLFGEITDPAKIRGWMASACLAISGILLLSYNHLPPSAPAILKKN